MTMDYEPHEYICVRTVLGCVVGEVYTVCHAVWIGPGNYGLRDDVICLAGCRDQGGDIILREWGLSCFQKTHKEFNDNLDELLK